MNFCRVILFEKGFSDYWVRNIPRNTMETESFSDKVQVYFSELGRWLVSCVLLCFVRFIY